MAQWLVPLTVLMSAWTSSGAAIETCNQQSKCLDLTYTTGFGPCADCQYKVCVTVDSNREGCPKNGDGTISHGCFSTSPSCDSLAPAATFNFGGNSGPVGYPSNFPIYSECFDVEAGDSFYFILKDGNGCQSLSADQKPAILSQLPAGSSVDCAPAPTPASPWTTGQSCSGNSDGKECVWKLTLPPAVCGPPTPCTWNDWSDWVETATCGTNTKTHTRTKNPATNGGAQCDGFSQESVTVELPACDDFGLTGDKCLCNDAYRSLECLVQENQYVGNWQVNFPNCDVNVLYDAVASYGCSLAQELDPGCTAPTIFCTEHIPDEVIAKLPGGCAKYIKPENPLNF